MQIRIFYLNLGTSIKNFQANKYSLKDIFKRNENIINFFFRNNSGKHCILTLRTFYKDISTVISTIVMKER